MRPSVLGSAISNLDIYNFFELVNFAKYMYRLQNAAIKFYSIYIYM